MASTASAGTIWFWTESTQVVTDRPPEDVRKPDLPFIQALNHRSPI